MKMDKQNNKTLTKFGMILQVICAIGTLALAILSFFQSKYLNMMQLLLGLTILIMAFNNHRLYRRKGFTVLYILVGLFIIGFVIMKWI